jgi:F-type H+-transporting ATPase subunit b
MGLIKALGIDGRILLAQFINFAVLMWVLWRYAYKPVFKMLEERKAKVEQGLDDAEKAALSLKEAEVESKKIILEARQEAIKLLEQAQSKGEERQQEIIKKAELEIGAIMEKERMKISAEKANSLTELKGEVSQLVMIALQKFLEDNLDDKKDQELVAKIVSNLGDKS